MRAAARESSTSRSTRVRRLRAIHFAPALVLVALLAWAFASPVGASPDDDFHLVSTWCAVEDGSSCAPGDSATTRRVPEALLGARCFAMKPEVSAACQDGLDFGGEADTSTDRGNFNAQYPPVYYAIMHVFVGPNAEISALVMRAVNALIFTILVTGLFLLLPTERRPTLVWPWVIGSVPMALFLVTSNNPSGWAVIGLGTGWLALLGYLETSGWRKWTLGAVATIATVMAAGARGDSAVYAILGIGAVFILTVPLKRADLRRYALDAILPVILTLLAVLLFLSARQSAVGVTGFGGGSAAGSGAGDPAAALSPFALFAFNLLNIPYLWAGNFGEWGLGWLDTAMPAVVSYGVIGCLVAVGFVALGRMWVRKLLVVIGAGLALWVIPVYVLTAGGDFVGVQVQPRYLLPLIMLFLGLVVLTRPGRGLAFTRLQLVLLIATISAANLVALHMNLRRYLTGVDGAGWNLDSGVEWWWAAAPSPMTVWLVGSLAFAAAVTIVVREVAWPRRGESRIPIGPTATAASHEMAR